MTRPAMGWTPAYLEIEINEGCLDCIFVLNWNGDDLGGFRLTKENCEKALNNFRKRTDFKIESEDVKFTFEDEDYDMLIWIDKQPMMAIDLDDIVRFEEVLESFLRTITCSSDEIPQEASLEDVNGEVISFFGVAKINRKCMKIVLGARSMNSHTGYSPLFEACFEPEEAARFIECLETKEDDRIIFDSYHEMNFRYDEDGFDIYLGDDLMMRTVIEERQILLDSFSDVMKEGIA